MSDTSTTNSEVNPRNRLLLLRCGTFGPSPLSAAEQALKPRRLRRGYSAVIGRFKGRQPVCDTNRGGSSARLMRQYRESHSVVRRYPHRVDRCGYRQKTSKVLPNPARIGITGAWHSLYHDGMQTRGSQLSEDGLRGKPRRLPRGGCHPMSAVKTIATVL